MRECQIHVHSWAIVHSTMYRLLNYATTLIDGKLAAEVDYLGRRFNSLFYQNLILSTSRAQGMLLLTELYSVLSDQLTLRSICAGQRFNGDVCRCYP